MRGTVIGHNFKPLAVTETPPSHHSSRLGSRSSSVTKIPGPSPLSRASRSSMASSAASAPLTPKHGDYLYITSTPSPLAARSTNRDASDFRPRLRAQVSTPHFSNRLAGGYGSATGGSQRDSMISLDSSPGAEELENMIRSMRPARAAARAVVGLGAGVGAGAGAGTGSGAGVGAGGGSGRARATSVTGRAREGGLSISAGPVMNKAAMLRARAMEVKNERAGKKGGWR